MNIDIVSLDRLRSMLGSYRGKAGVAQGGIPPVRWRPLADRLCISVALLRTIHELVPSKIRLIFKNYVKMALGSCSTLSRINDERQTM